MRVYDAYVHSCCANSPSHVFKSRCQKCVSFLCQSSKVCLDKAACKNVIVIVIVIDDSVIVLNSNCNRLEIM